ncbi:hypothetical protein GGC64_005941 [Mycobacterium sp. OAS707]|uniref:DUF732 domain-containing protein n=1 Tax=Mycobacterium sp. OAS707 TaxID=2663822 RepID=UPI001789FB98|nr:DUF732 domain-containing protein [Mycobacterium sp. OAS707]MBE1551854.1 hypothetical protein [Mycobacterium sp. OAS707]
MRARVVISAIGAALSAAAICVAPASADPDGDYLGALGNTPGVIGGPVNNGIYVAAGHHACDILRGGGTHDDAVNQLTVPIYVQSWLAQAMVDAAQSALCPDTKH